MKKYKAGEIADRWRNGIKIERYYLADEVDAELKKKDEEIFTRDRGIMEQNGLILKLNKEIARLRRALEFYADKNQWFDVDENVYALYDCVTMTESVVLNKEPWKIAREALAPKDKEKGGWGNE